MKFCKNLMKVVELSDPEWGEPRLLELLIYRNFSADSPTFYNLCTYVGPYWMNYKFLKKKINGIVEEQGGVCSEVPAVRDRNPRSMVKSTAEVEFFKVLMFELKKTAEFFSTAEELYKIRLKRVLESYQLLKENESSIRFDRTAWTRLLQACVKFYKDILLLENFAIMNYCGFSKILKKHDKLTG